jgi:DNA-binding transcriptional LysR family regulator
MLQTIATAGSFAAAARKLNLVPSALTYRVRSIEEALDVLLFDRSSRQARLTEAGDELLRQSQPLLLSIDAIANRVKRVATGWEPQFTIAIDSLISRSVIMDLAEAFFELKPPTRLRIRDEVLSGTFDSLVSGRADLALGVSMEPGSHAGIRAKPLGQVAFVFAVAPHHALALAPEPLADELLAHYRVVAVADSTQAGSSISIGIFSGQEVFTVATMRAKLDAQIRGLGIGLLPEPLARPYLESGRLVEKQTVRTAREARTQYAWRQPARPGRALDWWLSRLESTATRSALLHRMH